MNNHFSKKIKMYFYCLGILWVLSVLLFSCNSSKGIYKYDTGCEVEGLIKDNTTDMGNYFYLMEISKEKFFSLYEHRSLKRFVFQFKNVKSVDGRNEYEIASYTWNRGLFVTDAYHNEMFLERFSSHPPVLVDPKGSFSIVNLELRRRNIKKDAFKDDTKIYLVPYYNSCKKVMSLKMVGNVNPKSDLSFLYKPTKPNLNPNYAISAGYRTPVPEMKFGHFLDEEFMKILKAASELEINPCPPDIPRGR